MKLKKPKFEAPNLKVPPFLADVYHDLRERRLLPLVALVAVAILAVPFLLGESETAPPPPKEVLSTPTLEADPASLTVVEARPGLRDYKKRLRGRTPANPFKQRFRGLPEGAELSVETSTSPTSEGGSTTTTTDPTADVTDPSGAGGQPPRGTTPGSDGGGTPGNDGSDGGATPGDDGGSSPGKGETREDSEPRVFDWRPDVRFGVAGSNDLSLFSELPLGSFLPRRDPVLVFIGATQDGKRALFDVSPEVVSVQGEGNCVGGRQSCRTLSLRAGQAANLLTESAGRAFRVAVDRIEFVELHLPRRSDSSDDLERRSSGLSTAVSQNFSN